jgi:hypothetical protein
MSDTTPKTIKLTTYENKTDADLALPSILRASTRSGVSEVDPLLAGLVVQHVFTLGTPTRGEAAGKTETLDTDKPQLLAIETEDGTTLFIRSDTLAEAVARLQPDAVVNGVVDFSLFHDPNTQARGIGDVLWKVASVLRLPTDDLEKEAKDLAFEWAKEKLGDRVAAGRATGALPLERQAARRRRPLRARRPAPRRRRAGQADAGADPRHRLLHGG